MFLTHDIILNEIKNDGISITPFDVSLLGPASYDLTLSDEFRKFTDHLKIPVNAAVDYRDYTEFFKAKRYVLNPGELIIGISKETIRLSQNICGRLEGRTRFARLGLVVHITAAFVQPGVHNRQVFEIFNAGPIPLELKAGEQICQILFARCEGKAGYTGWTQNQSLRK